MKYGWRQVMSRIPKGRVDNPCGYVGFGKDCLDTDKGDVSYIWLVQPYPKRAALQIPVGMPAIAAFRNSHQS